MIFNFNGFLHFGKLFHIFGKTYIGIIIQQNIKFVLPIITNTQPVSGEVAWAGDNGGIQSMLIKIIRIQKIDFCMNFFTWMRSDFNFLINNIFYEL